MVGRVRLVEHREALFVGHPVELARVHDNAADGGAVAANVFGQRMHDDIRPQFKGPAQIGSGHSVIHNYRYAVPTPNLRQALNVHHVARRVTYGLTENRLGVLVNEAFQLLVVVVRGHADFNSLAGQTVGEQAVSTSIQLAGTDNVVASGGDALNGVGNGRHTRSHPQGGNSTFHRRNARFQHGSGGVHDASINIALDLQVEQIRPVLGIVKGV